VQSDTDTSRRGRYSEKYRYATHHFCGCRRHACAFPLFILAVGIPIALFVRLMVETGRVLLQL
jgi:hypothetical protein